MQIGLQIPSFKGAGGAERIGPALAQVAGAAEAAGFHSLWVMDHYYQIQGLFGEAFTDPMLEAYTALGFLAGQTQSARLGVMVTGVIYRHPAVLLKMASTLDILSGGRAYLGIGAAWYEDEARGFGIPYPTTKDRFAWLEETLRMARTLWAAPAGETVAFDGEHFPAPAMTNNPPPVRADGPAILIGGMGPNKTLRMVAQYADACNFFEGAGLERVQEAIDTLKGQCERLGRDYDTIEKTSLGTVHLAPEHDTVSDVLARLQTLAGMGFTHALVNLPNLYEMTPLDVFAQEIIPAAAQF
jgi:F420-dependent oxidoreductase-like protein